MQTDLAAAANLAATPLEAAGPVVVWLVVLGFVFAECAFIVGLFLPGDSLLLTAGVVLAQHDHEAGIWLLSLTVTLVAVAGNQVGYEIGARTGLRLLARRGGRVLNRENLDRAKRFFDRWGFWAIVAARWLPWVRTLAPILAGAAQMDRRKYLVASATGAVVWAPTLMLVGYYGAGLLDRNPWLRTAAVVGFLTFVIGGTVYGLWRYRQEIHRPVEDGERVSASPRGDDSSSS
ncbi:membrane-associated protein [Streptoalloteichus tenebrarius]|uniref:Membrane-associated protein n=1 Tax=Streptoalloteichus tenebrarius (strain ATCC 17920 / DSM 40477 / JCM 4838 / CBS 697.72 / NBRC 16177 / NCIMB 11028 / NRRL B-12390 / A12253. 1 / ISP 5477) TaxID=1933 RepID=A0ABT1I3F4_STRSD|nr:DedA family protein [Streptoalloteichus tenebrarius]MCP2262321.1 membrane-associated protein [Streptoalloteichus tenebrarius]BFF02215.1 DedA family protein [Streptoalloteichus tenebrarius]